MSGVGPVEPGDGTHALDTPRADAPLRPVHLPGPLARLWSRHRRAVLITGSAAVVLAGALVLHLTHPQPPAPGLPPYPSQETAVMYLGMERPEPNSRARSFRFGIEISAVREAGVTVSRIGQPYAGLTLSSVPRPPFDTAPEAPRTVMITMHVTDCGKVPKNAGLPFLDVTLRNTRAKEDHSFILGERYADDLSHAVQVACGNEDPSLPKSKNTAENARTHPARSQYVDRANRPEFLATTHRAPLCITSCHNKRVTAWVRLSSTFPTPA